MDTTDCSLRDYVPAHSPLVLAVAAIWSIALGLSGCGSGPGGAANAPVIPAALVVPVAISQQPVNQNVPMGLSATFSVAATGSSLQYQWAKNGAAIAGATSGTYATPATEFSDTGASFTVAVSNAAGTVSSSAASLTVTARAPIAGDLRFQQVDSASTVNGWGNAGVGLSTDIPARVDAYYTPSVGTPMYVGSAGNCATPPSQDGVGCAWFYSVQPLAPGGSPLIAGYGGDLYANFQADLQSPTATTLTFGNGVTAVSPTSVITSLDLEPASNLFAVSWVQLSQASGATASIQSDQQNTFTMEMNSTSPADLKSAAAQESAASRVITAISVNGSLVTYLAYAWQADTATIYDTQVVTASTAQAPAAAATLAAQGYVITAIGQADDLGNLYLVGTRVQGDTMARPFIAASGGSQLMQQGYAIVGVIFNSTQSDPYTYLGER